MKIAQMCLFCLQHSHTCWQLKGGDDLTRVVVFPSEMREKQGSHSVFKGVIIMTEQRINARKTERKDIGIRDRLLLPTTME